jgi:hypothetical protein
METEDLRREAKQLLHQAGIGENRPYHIKHASVTCLKEKGASLDDITNFCRHKMSSTVYMELYMSQEFGKARSEKLEAAMLDEKEEERLEERKDQKAQECEKKCEEGGRETFILAEERKRKDSTSTCPHTSG